MTACIALSLGTDSPWIQCGSFYPSEHVPMIALVISLAVTGLYYLIVGVPK